MRMGIAASLLLCGLSSSERILAQAVDPDLMKEVTAVRAEIARSLTALHQYTWTEQIEVFVNGKLKSSNSLVCHYDSSGKLVQEPTGTATGEERAKAVSNRPTVRSKADEQDYIERAISRIHNYVPPNPEQIDALLQRGEAARGNSTTTESEVRFTHYFEGGDSLLFTYGTVSKVLLRARIACTLANPKDPVTLDAVFETLPDGVNHLSSATLNAKRKNVRVIIRNIVYQKMTN
jgi:hypothetical protein